LGRQCIACVLALIDLPIDKPLTPPPFYPNWICFDSEVAQEFGRPKANLKMEAFYLKFIFESFLMQNYLLNCHN